MVTWHSSPELSIHNYHYITCKAGQDWSPELRNLKRIEKKLTLQGCKKIFTKDIS